MMKTVTIFFVLLVVSSPLFSEEIFFECTIDKFGSFVKISYDPDKDTGTLESDFNSYAGTQMWKTTSIVKTSDEVIFEICSKHGNCSSFHVNRSTLELSGRRDGQCKIIEKKNKF